ncbi:lysoplasmalogenase [Paenibacillus sp. JCM 10914]|uniref:lysoplasmalogenase n=1 Tax=Paenibacillus sp. JCM 10914 TaxID=1236974 RepID=UPI0003CC8F8E|nr:lysoplasmalogenase [Paenibacillus sp. JCM 10914]GAE07882.1 putative membrane protein [Paenibacillus sp. JCM 10914]
MKKWILPVIILVMSILYIFFIPSDPMAVKLLFKVIPMLLIIAYAYLHFPSRKSIVHPLLLIGLFFCMIGDATLIWFIVGLSAFLIGHLFYTAGFLTQWRYSLLRLLSIVPIAIYSAWMGIQLVSSLKLNGQAELIIPVIAYITVISLMLWSAVMTGNLWATFGSLLFVISDSILSWNMFVSGINHSGIWIMTTYYAAQFLIASSVRTGTVGQGKRTDLKGPIISSI